ncbi:MAG TPA: hypothetical protein DIS59_01770 [Candidatus Magasanikbacteria bacterium]|uniref:Uncharacterized protein n=1 Tax=Candidatus Magasanikbacteria bacterium GW2011_GWE2_42_7 TaxID=1619052 RepID=A0A0G1DQX5_9BACT|nr:MAG: hypothetical protein UV42_C0001G0016 [Candidatus Magasanikbacteria bacterium GW2011_GWE2_42_7]HBB38215.1 hypothetical protein [Candidatus Magasanikbacteria bacterium]HCM53657.1 hypothetical protein [Candidatus Magasanikbacteria bacterium]
MRYGALGIPYVHLSTFVGRKGLKHDMSQARRLFKSLKQHSAVFVRDPRILPSDNERYLNMLEDYFGNPYKDRVHDQRPDLGYHVGVSPPYIERPPDYRGFIARMPPEYRPYVTPCNCKGDPGERFSWPIGERPASTAFPVQNAADRVIPSGFKNEWASTMDALGEKMLETARTVCEMLALAQGLKRDTFSRLLKKAPHLLVPSGVNLREHGKKDTIIKAFNTDLNALTIHGKSRFPGLIIWGPDGQPKKVCVPDGWLLVQVGQQLEWLTGGKLLASFSEVVSLPETIKAMEYSEQEGWPLVSVSSTFFVHFRSDHMLRPLPMFLEGLNEDHLAAIDSLYPPILVGDQVRHELKVRGFA